MPGAEAATVHTQSPSQLRMSGAEATTKHAASSTRQAAPGAALYRANWHPQRSPSTTNYSIQVCTLLPLF